MPYSLRKVNVMNAFGMLMTGHTCMEVTKPLYACTSFHYKIM